MSSSEIARAVNSVLLTGIGAMVSVATFLQGLHFTGYILAFILIIFGLSLTAGERSRRG